MSEACVYSFVQGTQSEDLQELHTSPGNMHEHGIVTQMIRLFLHSASKGDLRLPMPCISTCARICLAKSVGRSPST